MGNSRSEAKRQLSGIIGGCRDEHFIVGIFARKVFNPPPFMTRGDAAVCARAVVARPLLNMNNYAVFCCGS